MSNTRINQKNYELVIGLNQETNGFSGCVTGEEIGNYSFNVSNGWDGCLIAVEDGKKQVIDFRSQLPIPVLPEISVDCSYDFTKGRKIATRFLNNRLVKRVTRWATNKAMRIALDIIGDTKVTMSYPGNKVTEDINLCGVESHAMANSTDFSVSINGEAFKTWLLSGDRDLNLLKGMVAIEGGINMFHQMTCEEMGISYTDSITDLQWKGQDFTAAHIAAESVIGGEPVSINLQDANLDSVIGAVKDAVKAIRS